MSPLVSLCMIVKNEGERLADCLRTVSGAVREIVIVDTGSSDDTVAVATAFGACISTFDFRQPDFSAARNRSLELATGDWILVLDADERLTSSAAAMLPALCGAGGGVGGAENVGYVVQRRNLRAGTAEILTDHAVRLFRNRPEHRYRGRVHETIDAAILASGGQIRTSRLAIEHHLPPDDGRSLEKSRFYLEILEQELALEPDNVERLGFLRAELHKLGLLDEATRTAERIAELAPDDAAHHVNVGLYRLVHRRDPGGAERSFRRALALAPGDTRVLDFLRELRDRRFDDGVMALTHPRGEP
jgi:glycosyltransferase involved in cell wall biosynthesis